jgi:glycosyltransferase involved in cell wall biosynthesis
VTSVLLVGSSAVAGGAERALLGLARGLRSLGVDVRAVVLEDGDLVRWLREERIETAVLDSGRARRLDRTVATTARVARLARHADVVVTSTSKAHVYGGAAAALARRPAIWWQHSIPHRTRFDVAAARVPAAAVVAVGADVAAAQRRLTPGRDIVVIHPGLPLDEIRRARGTGAALRRELGWGEGPVVGIVGRLQPWKGQETFLRAAALLGGEARFAVVGGAVLGWEGDYPQRLHALADELGLAGRVHFAGHQPDPWRWIDALDVFVHASRGEPFGLTVVEAMTLGKPVVAAAEGGPLEIVTDGSGLLVPPGDPQVLADALRRVLGDASLRERLGAAAEARALAFSEERMGQEFATLVQKVAAARR